MSRKVVVFVLLLTTVVHANAAVAVEAQAKTEAPPTKQGAGQPAEEAQAKTEAAPTKQEAGEEPAEEAHIKTEAAPMKQEAGQEQPEEAQAKTGEDGKLISVPGGKALGMSVLGNQEAPTSLVIVPWKTSELGSSLGISPMLDSSRQPVDKDVFMRALRYYEIRSKTKP